MFADLGHFNKRAIQVRDLKVLAFMLNCSSRMFIDGYVCCLSMGYLFHTLFQQSVLQSLLAVSPCILDLSVFTLLCSS